MSKNLTQISVHCLDIWAFVVALCVVLASTCAPDEGTDDDDQTPDDDFDDDSTADDDASVDDDTTQDDDNTEDDDNDDNNDSDFTSDQWVIEKIAEDEDSTVKFVFGLDQANYAHIAFSTVADQINYLSNTTGRWMTTVLDTNTFGGYGAAMDLVVRDDGDPVVGFCNGQYEVKLFYYENDWIAGTVPGAECWSRLSMDLSPSETLRIAYRANQTNTLLYREQTDDDWSSEAVTAETFNRDLLKNGLGVPVIGGQNEQDLYFYEKAGPSWVEWPVYISDDGHFTHDSGWAVDGTGGVHVVFEVGVEDPDDPAEGLYYGDNVTGVWRFEKIVVVGYSTTMAIDSQGLVNFVYQAYSPSDLEGIVYARGEYRAWTEEKVVDQVDAIHGQLALDADDRPYVVFTDSSYKNLYLARRKEIPR
jgi:hypothetical protein